MERACGPNSLSIRRPAVGTAWANGSSYVPSLIVAFAALLNSRLFDRLCLCPVLGGEDGAQRAYRTR